MIKKILLFVLLFPCALPAQILPAINGISLLSAIVCTAGYMMRIGDCLGANLRATTAQCAQANLPILGIAGVGACSFLTTLLIMRTQASQ